MSDTEQRVRQALRAEVDDYDGDPAAWDRVSVEVGRRRFRRRAATGLVVVALLVAGSVVALTGRAEHPRIVAGSGSASTAASPNPTADSAAPSTTAPPETTTTPPPATQVTEPFDGIWPFASRADLDRYLAAPGPGDYFDPMRTATAFARDYLEMPDPVAESAPSMASPGSTVSIAVRPAPNSTMTTIVELRRLGAAYVVIGASSDNIRVDEPTAGTAVTSPIAVRGVSTAFEATILGRVRAATGPGGEPTVLMGGANGTFAPFSGEVVAELPQPGNAGLVFFTHSAEDGSVQEATVVRVSAT